MGQVYQEIDANLRAFIEAQHVFFVATAPLAATGHLNVSPKGLDSLRVLGPRTMVYLDYIGSGAETIAHVRENGRIAIMWCALDGPPKIVRCHGRGEVIEPQDGAYERLRGLFPPTPDGRAIVRIDVQRISDSCGYGVPRYTYEEQRSQLVDWAARKGEQGLGEYQRTKNRVSIDQLPALRWTDL